MLWFGAALLLVSGAAAAQSFQETTISTDRPGIPYGTSIVPTGHLQLETGLPTFENDDVSGGHSLLLSTPTYLRYGFSDNFELQLGGSPFNRLTVEQDARRHTVRGLGDAQIGAKYALANGSDGGPALSLVGFATVPTGSSAFSNGRPAYNLNAVANWSLGNSNGLTTMVSYTRSPVAGDRYANTGTLAASLSHSFSERLGGYVEAGWFPGFSNAADTALAGAGATVLLTRHVQIDGFFDLGLNHASPNALFGTGLSILF